MTQDEVGTLVRKSLAGNNKQPPSENLYGQVSREQLEAETRFWRDQLQRSRLRLAKLWAAYQDLQRENSVLSEAVAKQVEQVTEKPRELPTSVTYAIEPAQNQSVPVQEAATAVEPARKKPARKRTTKKVAKKRSTATKKRTSKKAASKKRSTKKTATKKRSARKSVKKSAPPALKPHYPVGLYRIEKVPGINARERRALRDQGINLTDTLIHTDIAQLARSSGISKKKLDDWRAMSELMALKDIGPTWAQTLVKADVHGIMELARLTPDELTKTLLESYEKQRMSKKRITVLKRTLPTRASRLVHNARDAVQSF